MANALYSKAKQAFLNGSIDLTTDTIRVLLLDGADYTPDLAANQYLSDVPTAARIGNSGGTTRTDGTQLTTPSITNGVFDADDATITAASGDQAEYVLIYKDDGVADSSSPLIALLDTGTGLPVTPNGGDITIQWDSGASKIFAL